MIRNSKSDRDTEVIYQEAALILEDHVPPQDTTLPTAGKTPTTSMYEVDLATNVDGGRGDVCTDGMPSQGLHLASPSPDIR